MGDNLFLILKSFSATTTLYLLPDVRLPNFIRFSSNSRLLIFGYIISNEDISFILNSQTLPPDCNNLYFCKILGSKHNSFFVKENNCIPLNSVLSGNNVSVNNENNAL